MCYYLYGAINDGIHNLDYEKVDQSCGYHFAIGTKDDVNKCVKNKECDFRITNRYCDCDTAVGSHKTDQKELYHLKEMLISLQVVRGIKHVYMSKNWFGECNSKEITIHIQDIDIIQFLANIEDNCLYKIDLYKKYY